MQPTLSLLPHQPQETGLMNTLYILFKSTITNVPYTSIQQQKCIFCVYKIHLNKYAVIEALILAEKNDGQSRWYFYELNGYSFITYNVLSLV